MCSYVTCGSRSRLCVIPCHPCMRTCVWLLESSLFTPSLYFFLKSFFHLFLNPTMVPDENSMEDPLCNSSFGSMVSLDYVTPDTGWYCLSLKPTVLRRLLSDVRTGRVLGAVCPPCASWLHCGGALMFGERNLVRLRSGLATDTSSVYSL